MTSRDTVLYLIKLTSGKDSEIVSSLDAFHKLLVDWQEVIDIATEQGVLGICFDAIELLPIDQRPDLDRLMDWLGQVSFMETCYNEHLHTVADLATFYKRFDIRMMLLKGYGLSVN